MSSESNKPKPNIRDRLKARVASVRDVAASTLRSVADRIEGPQASFEVADTAIDFQFDLGAETLWATQQQMADLFGVASNTITEHLKNLFREGELDEDSVARKFRAPGKDGKHYNTLHYNLDAVIAVGYRVSSKRATEFRRWATSKLTAYLRDGFVLNEQRLRDDPTALQSLAEKVRALRFEEKSLYQRVRDCVAMVASDYDGSSDVIRSFFARMQDKFHYAACQKTSHELILSRADASKDMMGMSSYLSNKLTAKDAQVAKNYLEAEELRLEHIAGDAFFVFVENMAARGRTMTTAQLMAKIDEIFKFNEIPVFPGYTGPYLKDRALKHAKTQYDLFKARTAQERYEEAPKRLSPR